MHLRQHARCALPHAERLGVSARSRGRAEVEMIWRDISAGGERRIEMLMRVVERAIRFVAVGGAGATREGRKLGGSGGWPVGAPGPGEPLANPREEKFAKRPSLVPAPTPIT